MCDITIQANIFVSNMSSDIDVGFFFYYLILRTEYNFNGTALTSPCQRPNPFPGYLIYQLNKVTVLVDQATIWRKVFVQARI